MLTEFIELYRNHTCLWKIKSREYSDKIKKDAAYKILVEKLREINESVTKDDVVKKINSMRSSFRKEYKKVWASHHSGAGADEIYTPNLWYFGLLMFLKDQEMPRGSVGNDNPNCSGLLSQVGN